MPFANKIVVILGLLLAFDQVFAVNHYREFGEGRVEIDSSLSYFKSTSNFTSSGTIRDLPSGNSYQLIDILAGARYVYVPDMSFYFYGNIGSASSVGSGATRSNSTLNKFLFGGDMLFDLATFQLIPEVKGVFAIEKISETQDAVMNNEGVNEFTGQLNVQTKISLATLMGYAGYTYRQSRSSLLPWGFGAEFSSAPWSFGAELFGFQSLSKDPDKDTSAEATRDALRATVNGGSARFYSLNPSVVDSNVYLKVQASEAVQIWGALGMAVLGNNYANGYHAEVGLRYVFGGSSPVRATKKKSLSIPANERSRLSTDKKVDRFEEDTNDGVDQSIFQPSPPKPVTDESVKEKMDDVEMEIELRSNKKRKRRP